MTYTRVISGLLISCLLTNVGMADTGKAGGACLAAPYSVTRYQERFSEQTLSVLSGWTPHLLNQKPTSSAVATVFRRWASRQKSTLEAEVREKLANTPFKEVRQPNGGVLGAQSRVLLSEAADFVLKMARTRKETKDILWGWRWPGITAEDFESWLEAVDSGKRRGERIAATRLRGSRGMYPERVLGNVEFLEATESGVHPKRARRARVQPKGPEVVRQAIQRLYQAGDSEGIKRLLDEILETTKEEIWSYGVFDRSPSFVDNWAVEWDSDGQPKVGLFDFGELVDRLELIGDLSDKNDNSVAIYADSQMHSVLSLTNQEIADWFFHRVHEEYTAENLKRIWNTKTTASGRLWTKSLWQYAAGLISIGLALKTRMGAPPGLLGGTAKDATGERERRIEMAIAEFQARLGSETASISKLRMLRDSVGDEAFAYFSTSFSDLEGDNKLLSSHVSRMAAEYVEGFLRADAQDQESRLEEVRQFLREVYPHRGDLNKTLAWAFGRDHASHDQQTLREILCRTLSIPPARVIFIDPHDHWLLSLLGFDPGSTSGKLRLLRETFTSPIEKVIFLDSSYPAFESLQILAHEGSHWGQETSMYDVMENSFLVRTLCEGFQRYREYAVILKMAEDSDRGQFIRELTEAAFRKLPNGSQPSSFEDQLWNVINRHQHSSYPAEAAFVRELVNRIGVAPLSNYFLYGDPTPLKDALGNESFEMLFDFFKMWERELDVHKIVPIALATRLIDVGPITMDKRSRVATILGDLRRFYNEVLLKERITNNFINCFSPSTLFPLIDRYMAGNISPADFGRDLFYDLRVSGKRRTTLINWDEWFSGYSEFGIPPKASDILAPNETSVDKVPSRRDPSFLPDRRPFVSA